MLVANNFVVLLIQLKLQVVHVVIQLIVCAVTSLVQCIRIDCEVTHIYGVILAWHITQKLIYVLWPLKITLYEFMDIGIANDIGMGSWSFVFFVLCFSYFHVFVCDVLNLYTLSIYIYLNTTL